MVEANTDFTNELNTFLTEKIENVNRVQAEKHARKIEMFEELKMKVKPKMVMINRELAVVTGIFKDFSDKNQEDGKPFFTKTIEFY